MLFLNLIWSLGGAEREKNKDINRNTNRNRLNKIEIVFEHKGGKKSG